MVAQHYRWDFIGLSTDEKPTPQTSEKVVDGSTFYCSDNSKLYVFCGSQWYEKTVSGGGQYELPIASAETLGGVKVGSNLSIDAETGVLSATNTTYTAGSNVSISDENVISATDTTYTAGTNVSISDQNVISATDTTYSNFVGTDGTSAGTAGLVPAPATTDAGKFLKADGTWDTAGGGGGTPIHELTSADYNYPTNNPTKVRLDKLATGWYQIPASATSGVEVCYGSGGYNIGVYGDGYEFYCYVAKDPHETGFGAGRCTIYAFTDNMLKCVYVDGSGNPTSTTFTNNDVLIKSQISDSLTSNSANYVLSAKQGKVLKDTLDGAIKNGGTTVPTTSTVGVVGGLFSCVNSGTPEIYMCTAVSGSTYTWTKLI